MTITLITGTPGAGKTLFAVKTIVEELSKTGRPVYTNIAGLDPSIANVTICDDDTPLNWWRFSAVKEGYEGPNKPEYPDGSIFVFDEVQRQYPPRNTQSKVPPHISQYETHRHRGMDFYFITQGPRLLDRHLLDLVGRHQHLYRPFGMKMSQLFDWNGVNLQPNPTQTRTSAVASTFNFPRKYYKLYRSASQHTVKFRPPLKVLAILGGSICVLAYASVNVYTKYIQPTTNVEETSQNDSTEMCIHVRVRARTGTKIYVTINGRPATIEQSQITQTGSSSALIDQRGKAHAICGEEKRPPDTEDNAGRA